MVFFSLLQWLCLSWLWSITGTLPWWDQIFYLYSFLSHISAVLLPISGCRCLTAVLFTLSQEGVTSMTSHWSRLYFMTFYIVTMVRPVDSQCLRNICRSLYWSLAFICVLVIVKVCVVSVGGDDHHCGVHSGRICLPNELQPQEPGTSREPRGWDLVLLMLCRYKPVKKFPHNLNHLILGWKQRWEVTEIFQVYVLYSLILLQISVLLILYISKQAYHFNFNVFEGNYRLVHMRHGRQINTFTFIYTRVCTSASVKTVCTFVHL